MDPSGDSRSALVCESAVFQSRGLRERSDGAVRRRVTLFARLAAAAIGCAIIATTTSSQSALAASPPPPTKFNSQYIYSDWFENTSPGNVSSLFLTDVNRNAMNAFLEQQPAGKPLAVKITQPISNQTANMIFNSSKYHVSYVFGDLEGSSAAQQMKTLAQQIRFVNGQNNGIKTRSYNAFVGNFGFQKLSNDPTDPNSYNSQRGVHSFSGWSLGDYNNAKLNMSMPELYSASASYRGPAAGNSNAPNIRSAAFILPVMRISQVKLNTDASEQIVPWVARFNNWANVALDTDRNPANGYKFEPGKAIPAKFGLPALSAQQTKDQMLSRRDFAAQIAHYRLRGADGYVNFEPGVVGYLNDTKRADAKTGFTEPHIASIFNTSDFKLLVGTSDTDYPPKAPGWKDPNGDIIIDGKVKSDEEAGALFSGVYSLTLKRMDILISNMDENEHTLTLPPTVAGFDLKTKSFDLDGGAHLLVEYKLTTSGVNKGWSVMTKTFPFLQLPNNRNEVGIPEPANITWLALFAFVAVTPRRRKKTISM